MESVKISVISPIYGCKECLFELYDRLVKTLSQITENFEIILVNDACPQASWERIAMLCAKDPRVKGINLSRNFGQHYAITAGLDHAKGEWVVVMDCDLQDRPEEIIKLYNKALDGYDIVFGRRAQRQDSFIKRFGSMAFNRVLEYFTETKHDNSIANFGIYAHKVVETINRYREHSRDFLLFAQMVGFKKVEIDIEHAPRVHGESSYNFSKLFRLAIDSIISHSNKPLRLSIQLGFFIALASLVYASWLVIRYFFYHTPAEGWTSLMVSMFFMFGLLFAIIGITGLYIGKIFDEVKRRPLYLIQETLNL
ncbi:glycosyltransferase family 2 protein [Sulfurospirillum multivorans]|uniref:Glycosyltransferase family 2 protein n=2 Tax=Sulfurospirillum multivorans TaxID=66821 RepID=A0AA86ALE7_SULMK|nr:glycosyltransferase family 2 protein [Sulfurospirillum multivorans]AHJ11668.1 glycosyltransferase family 2 protein [Sulfurospirillum multivorans DSM 12446]QEH05168.1 glycosyltransferase family 2 protein [Sulfurospirillum multivorans]